MQHDAGDRRNLLSDLLVRLCGPVGTGDHLRAIAAACEEARGGRLADDPALMAELEAATAGLDPILRESALACVSGDLRRYAAILDRLENVLDLAALEGVNHIYWCMQRQLFLMRMDAATAPDFLTSRLFPFYERFVGEIARRLDAHPVPRPAGAPATGRVVMVTNQLLSGYHQPSRDMVRQAARLQQDCGREVLILNTNMMPESYYSPFVPPFAAAVEEQLNGEQVATFEGQRIRMLSSIQPGLGADKVKGFLAAVEAFDPDVVIGFGGSVVIADLLAPARPLVHIPTTSGTPVTLADIALDYGGTAPPAGGGRLAAAWRPFRLGMIPRRDGDVASGGASGVKGGRAAFGIPDDAFACVVVGNRLDAEVDAAFLALLERVLDAVPRATVLFAGAAEALPGRLERSRHAGRLRPLGFVEHMEGLLGLCDLFLNPRRTGGGGSAVHALAAGVPALSLAVGDVASVVGPAFLVDDEEAFVARAAALAGDAALLEQARADARDRFAVIAAEGGDATQLASYLDEAVTLFRKRTQG
ncbi:glycosyltransferase [Azospirillum rugosum]|uniref:Glycosyl transferases group 1 n=1 Tax=Azospirillum rugosum TaxID=416170 RepID=A0ABS4SLJ7_9PROT|nr:glycosyltransferase [Azospirillum rugosum]MBP2292822.1 hypothetical protein [Azospirillum rugosum]MDQ0527081.1 hypothetical protein [Azospirillum rugosum]